MLKKEWKGLLNNRILLIVIIAVIVIPDNLYDPFPGLNVGSVWKSGQTSCRGVNRTSPSLMLEKNLRWERN